MATILITGGAGFIGSHLANALVLEDHRVVIVDNLSRGKKERVNQSALFYKADIENQSDLSRIFQTEHPSYVFHLAAHIDVRKSVEQPSRDAMANIIGTLNLLELSARHKIKKFVFASSGGALYGDQAPLPTPETHNGIALANPISPYGIAKLCAENYILFFSRSVGLPYSILRFANVYGPFQDCEGEAGVIAIFIHQFLKNTPPVIYGTGGQTRDFVFIDDVIDALLKSWRQKENDIYNIGTGNETSINEIAHHIKTLVGSPLDSRYKSPKMGDAQRSCLDAKKAKQKLSWEPKTSLKRGISKTIASFKAYN